MMRYQIRPLGQWTDPVTIFRKPSSVFRAGWEDTLALLRDEAEQLDVTYPIVIQVDVTELDLRQDGMLRSRARVGPNPGVVVSFGSKHGPLRYATDAYEQSYVSAPPGWQANVRAIALSLQALRAVDRYGVSKTGQQYTGWRALPATGGVTFPSAEAALRWMQDYAGGPADLTPRQLYRLLARDMHPDAGGDPASWERLDAAKVMLAKARML